MFGGEGDEAMAKLTASLTRKFSVELTDGQWESAEASFSFEEDVDQAEPKESKEDYAARISEITSSIRAFVKAQVDAEMKRQKEEVLGNPIEAFAEEVGGEAKRYPPAEDATILVSDTRPKEEKPPLPAGGREAEPAPGEIVRTPLTDNQASFKVRWFEVAKTANGDKYLKCFGKGDWKREWVPAWSDVAELLFGDIEDMDTGELQPPYPLEATVEMGEYKNPKSGKTSPSPQKVVEWTRVG